MSDLSDCSGCLPVRLIISKTEMGVKLAVAFVDIYCLSEGHW